MDMADPSTFTLSNTPLNAGQKRTAATDDDAPSIMSGMQTPNSSSLCNAPPSQENRCPIADSTAFIQQIGCDIVSPGARITNCGTSNKRRALLRHSLGFSIHEDTNESSSTLPPPCPVAASPESHTIDVSNSRRPLLPIISGSRLNMPSASNASIPPHNVCMNSWRVQMPGQPRRRPTVRKTVFQMQGVRDLSPGQRSITRRQELVGRHQRYQARNVRRGDTPPPSLPSSSSTVGPLETSNVVALSESMSPPRSPQSRMPRFLKCLQCKRQRSRRRFSSHPRSTCMYCLSSQIPLHEQFAWCSKGNHERPHHEFWVYGGYHSACASHYRPAVIRSPSHTSPPPPTRPASSTTLLLPATTLPLPLPPAVAIPEPVAPSLGPDLASRAISDEHWKLIECFQAELSAMVPQTCQICHERSPKITLSTVNGQASCKRCLADLKMNPDLPPKFGAANEMDPGVVDPVLPTLSMAEELLIARAHVSLSVWTHKGQQYHYSGHVITFMQNTAKIVTRLPSLPSDLQILRLVPPSSTGSDGITVRREFAHACRVNRGKIQQWLTYLCRENPAYRGMVIDDGRLSQLPEDGSILEELAQRVVLSPQPETNAAALPQEVSAQLEMSEATVLEETMVPHLALEETERELVASAFRPAQSVPQLSMATLEDEPMSEYSGEYIPALAFPTLFPRGQALFSTARCRTVGIDDYHRHLFLYEDRRFAQHPQFRYWVFNAQQREKARRSAVFRWRGGDETLPDYEALATMANDSRTRLHEWITRSTNPILGTRPYWNHARTELQAMVRQLNCPSVFFTLSAADLQWADFFQHMPPVLRQEYYRSTQDQRTRLAAKYLQKNPMIAAEWLDIRFRTFLNHVIKRIFKIKDFWYRFEWQKRGSGHVHGFLWIEDAPIYDDTNPEPFVTYWSKHALALNPGPAIQPSADHPSSRPFCQRQNTCLELAQNLNRYQRHTKCPTPYCTRRDKHTGQDYCRFGFPKEIRNTAGVVASSGRDHFEPERNDPLLGNYNPAMTLAWQANTDFTPCTGQNAVISYIAKYCAKSESKSWDLQQVTREAMTRVPDDARNPIQSLAIKTMNALIGERDWSAQEVCHLLLRQNLSTSSRGFQTINLSPVDQQDSRVDLNSAEQSAALGKKYVEIYCERPAEFGALSLLEYAQSYTKSPRGTLTKRQKERVVILFPRYCSEPGAEGYADFCRAKLMLHRPFRSAKLDDLRIFDDRSFDSWVDAYAYFRLSHEMPPDTLGESEQPIADDQSDSDSDISVADGEDVRHQGDEILAARRPNFDGRIVEEMASDATLGTRAQDLCHDWLSDSSTITNTLVEELESANVPETGDEIERTTWQEPGVDVASLNTQQRVVHDTVTAHCARREGFESQLLMTVDGQAGTGKTRVIDCIKGTLDRLHFYQGRSPSQPPVILAAPTGIAAHLIGGQTLHQLLRLPIRKAFDPLSNDWLQKMEHEFRHCEVLIVDEKSMVGCEALYQVDQRLRQIKHRPDEWFGGMHVVLFGDFAQLPPIAAAPLYAPDIAPGRPPRKETSEHGRRAYHQFTVTVKLTEIMRQQGTSGDDIKFRLALGQMRDGPISHSTWEFLKTRLACALPTGEWRSFDQSLRLYHMRKDVEDYNLKCLTASGKPVLRVQAKNVGRGAAAVDADDAGRLENSLLLTYGSNVMLTYNMAVEEGLVNGSRGRIKSFVWHNGVTDAFNNMPALVLVHFPEYLGHKAIRVHGELCVAIRPRTQQYDNNGHSCQRTQFPLVLADAMTIHKSQGLTLDKVVLTMNKIDFSPGQSYVAFSRVRNIKDLALDGTLDFDRFPKDFPPKVMARKADERRRDTRL